MKLLSGYILIIIWVFYSHWSIPGNLPIDAINKSSTTCHTDIKSKTTESEDCCGKFNKKEPKCEKQNENSEEKDDCCKSSHCPRTCCQTLTINFHQATEFEFAYSYLKPVFHLDKQNNLPEPYLGIVPPPPNNITL